MQKERRKLLIGEPRGGAQRISQSAVVPVNNLVLIEGVIYPQNLLIKLLYVCLQRLYFAGFG